MQNSFSHILEMLDKYNLSLEDIENYMINLNLKNGKIFNIVLSLITSIIFVTQNESETIVELIISFPVGFAVMYMIFSIFIKIGQSIFVGYSNPYKSTNELRSLHNLNNFYLQSEKRFIKFLEKVVEDKKNNKK